MHSTDASMAVHIKIFLILLEKKKQLEKNRHWKKNFLSKLRKKDLLRNQAQPDDAVNFENFS